MTYHCGIGPGLQRLGLKPCGPHLTCDGCGTVYNIVARPRRGPPKWLVDGKAPKGWTRLLDDGEGLSRHYCPRCRPAKPGTTWHVVVCQSSVCGVFGSALLDMAQACARVAERDTGFPAFVVQSERRPKVGDAWNRCHWCGSVKPPVEDETAAWPYCPDCKGT